MVRRKEKRKEERLSCNWSIWFAENLGETLYSGTVCDISSKAVSFTCHVDKNFPLKGKEVRTQFSVPRLGREDKDVTMVTRNGKICRYDTSNSNISKVAVRFYKPLPFHPNKLKTVNKIINERENRKVATL